MDFSQKMMSRFFRQVDGVVWDLFSGKIGVQTADGITTLEGAGEDAQVSVNMFDQFGMPVPAFAQSTPLDAVAIGDLIYGANKPMGWVIEIKDRADTGKKFVLMSPSGTSHTWTPPKVSMLGFDSGVMVLRSLMNMLPGGNSGLNAMQGMLMPLMMMGGDLDLEKIMPMMLFSQLGASGNGSDAMGMNNNMVQMMMMAQMMGGKSGSPFDMFKTGKSAGKGGKNFFDVE